MQIRYFHDMVWAVALRKSKQRAKSNEQRAKSNKQRAKSNEERATSKKFNLKIIKVSTQNILKFKESK